MKEDELKREFEAGAEKRTLLASTDQESPSARHDQAILAAARAAALRMRSPSGFWPPRLRVVAPLLASFAVGAATLFLLDRALLPTSMAPEVTQQLRIPIRVASRDAGSQRTEIPVEQADPQVWYRYIQELIYAGDREQAERHLRRFNQLHPDFVYRP